MIQYQYYYPNSRVTFEERIFKFFNKIIVCYYNSKHPKTYPGKGINVYYRGFKIFDTMYDGTKFYFMRRKS